MAKRKNKTQIYLKTNKTTKTTPKRKPDFFVIAS
jgi:hypothetical protein